MYTDRHTLLPSSWHSTVTCRSALFAEQPCERDSVAGTFTLPKLMHNIEPSEGASPRLLASHKRNTHMKTGEVARSAVQDKNLLGPRRPFPPNIQALSHSHSLRRPLLHYGACHWSSVPISHQQTGRGRRRSSTLMSPLSRALHCGDSGSGTCRMPLTPSTMCSGVGRRRAASRCTWPYNGDATRLTEGGVWGRHCSVLTKSRWYAAGGTAA